MNLKWILLVLLLCVCVMSACKKEELLEPDGVTNQTSQHATNSSMRLGDLSSITNIDNPATHRGMYIDGANNIIGNTTKENALITYAVNKGINSFAFYGLKSVISTSANYSKMASFLSRCSQNGITNFVYVVVYYPGSKNGLDTTYIRKYNNSRSSSAEKFDGVNLEWEFWNGATSWSTYLTTLKSFYNWTRKVTPNLCNEVYFGWFSNPATMPQTMADEMVTYCDRILLHDYRTSPSVSYMESRLDYFGLAAVDQGKTKKIIVLFSAEGDYMGPYYSSHSYNDAYQTIASQYATANIDGKAGLRIYGWEIYNYTYAKQYRP
jgi:hypothetical protein